ncbi:MAG: hypothetical protein IPM50_01740 [Acidobacteriota bacterium]|nr:MAG: hypothetical protein IPM50_01740 [Acidobacteriota bacterium]
MDLRTAVEYYHELLSDNEVAAASLAMLDEQLESSKLIFGGRRLTPYLRPHFVRRSDWKRVVAICETVFGALQKVKDAALEDENILNELGLTEIEKDLIRINPGYSHVSPTARLDSFLTDDAYSFVELNGESPAGIAFSDSATEIFKQLPVMRRFAERYTYSGLEGRSKMRQVLLDCYEEYLGHKPETPPTIAIVDLKDLPTIKEFELFRDHFNENGLQAVICTPEDLSFEGSRLMCGELEIDVVYKRLLVNEYLPIADEYPALLDAYRDGKVCMVNSFCGKLVHKKAVFSILTDERYTQLFNDIELDAIRLHIPWTRNFTSRETRYSNEEVDLVEWTRENSSKLVLKPNDDYGGHGIFIGWNSDPSEWDEAIEVALADGDYLVQERVPTAKEVFPMITDDSGNWQLTEQLVDLDPLLFTGKVGSAFTRLSSSELANVTAGGGMVPTFIIEDE